VSLIEEIREQPAAVLRLLDSQREHVGRIGAALAVRDPLLIVVAARGSSDHAAIYAQYVFGALHRLPVALATPALTSLYGVAPRMERAVVVGISQSGQSPDVVGVLEAARGQGAPTVAITNAPASELASAAEHVIDIGAGPERATAATKTYTSSLVAVAMLADALAVGRRDALGGDDAGRSAALDAVPTAMETALASEPSVESVARAWASQDNCIVLGRGFEYATAREWALKLKELAQVAADPYSAADFQHGPLALVEPGYPILAVAPSGVPNASMRVLLHRLRGDYHVDLVVISDDPGTRDLGTASLELPGGTAEWTQPVVSILPAQLFAYHVTAARGLDTESPRWISKVTLTR
jgi:glucosamine--fructose-6-phosphate aminotransferase (isomerizing)